MTSLATIYRLWAGNFLVASAFVVSLKHVFLRFLSSVNGMSQRIVLPLPLFVSKFFSPTEMNSQDFFSRWKQLGK